MNVIFDNPTLAMIALILGFGFLIFIHELGHFAVAKWVGIRATQFAIGFGNAICSYRRGIGLRFGGTEKEYVARAVEALEAEGRSVAELDEHARNQLIMEKADALGLGETEYRLNTLPLGGYVKMLGQEDMDPAAQSSDPRAFNRKSVGARAAVISAGVIMNLIFGLIFFMICFQMGVRFPAAVVGAVAPQSPAATTFARDHEGDPAYRGLRIGDTIVAADGKAIEDMTGVKIATALGKAGQPVALTVQREGEPQPLTYDITPRPDPRQESLLSAGIAPSPSLRIIAVFEDTPFAEAGVEAGSTITAIDGAPVVSYSDYAAAVDDADGEPVTLAVTAADGQIREVLVSPRPAFRHVGGQPQLLGLVPGIVVSRVMEDSPAEAAGVQSGDMIARLGDLSWPTDPNEISDEVQGADRVALRVWRDGQPVDLGDLEPRGGLIGIGMDLQLDRPVVAAVLADSPLASANLPAGSTVLEVGGTPIEGWADLQRALSRLAPDPATGRATATLKARVNLGEQPTETFNITLSAAQIDELQHGGWDPPGNVGLDDLMVEIKATGPVDAAMIGAVKTKEFIQQTYITLLRLFQGSVAVKNLRGPVGIVDEGAKIAARGTAYYLFFLGLISVNLAVLNFLPIPIVDGGLMVFLLIEKIKGSPASPKVQIAVSIMGLVGLACIFLYVTYNDIARLVTG